MISFLFFAAGVAYGALAVFALALFASAPKENIDD
jgi:hypothetical protein